MPELPEVETIIQDLRPQLLNKKILSATVYNPGSINQTKTKFRANLKDQKIIDISRRGKNIILKFKNFYLVIHLKMTGQLVWQSGSKILAGGHPILNVGRELPNKFTRVILRFSKGSLYFNDVRKFGWLKIMSATELGQYLNKLGAEPLTADFSWSYFKDLFTHKRIAIKLALLDQKYIAGLGNIYVDEALWDARIIPTKPAGELSISELKKLQISIKKVLLLSISKRGTSFSDYRDGLGQKGDNLKFLKVYGKKDEHCPRCKNNIKKIKIGGRGTHWCDHCQK